MKKYILIIAIAMLGVVAAAQETERVMTFAASEITANADSIVPMVYMEGKIRPIILMDSTFNYYVTFKEYAIQFDNAILQLKNSNGYTVLIRIKDGEEIDVELPKPKIKMGI